jgi:hypothetical protein
MNLRCDERDFRSLFSAFFCVLAASFGCATVPNGELQLGPKIVQDMQESRIGTKAINKGRPVYIEARSYPQVLESGDIWLGGPVMLNLGREDLSLDDLVNPEAVDGKTSSSKAGEG